MNVIAYCRVSTAEQSDSGVSLDAQQAKMRAYADLYNLTIVETIIDAESAKSLRRDGLQRALNLLRTGKADGLLIVKLDRLTRSVADWQALIDAYFGERGGKQLFAWQRFHRHPHGGRSAGFERFDYRRPMGAGDDRREDERGPSAQDQQSASAWARSASASISPRTESRWSRTRQNSKLLPSCAACGRPVARCGRSRPN